MVIDALLEAGVDTIFGYPGGAIMPFFDVLMDAPIRHILTRHEQMAVHAADAYARSSGRLGVAVCTSGPGATNLATGICTAYMDSSPVLCVSGQVAEPFLGTDAFQEADVYAMVAGMTKQAFLVRTLEELPEIIAEAIFVTTTGRPGPVLVDLCKDVQVQKADLPSVKVTSLPGYDPQPPLDMEKLHVTHDMLKAAKRPVCIIGGGCRYADAADVFRRWCDITQVPVANTLQGTGAPHPDYAGRLGMVGVHGLRRANEAICECDLLIALGMRMDDRVTGKVESFAPKAKIVHVDIDAAELGKIVQPSVAIHADLKDALAAWLDLLDSEPVEPAAEWRDECMAVRSGLHIPDSQDTATVQPTRVLDELFTMIGTAHYVTTDVGQNQMWTCQRVLVDSPRKFMSSGGAGTMGYGFPAAIGTALARPGEKVVAVVGDGGFQMALAELATLARLKVPVKIIILDNKYLGMVRQWQELFFDRRYSGTSMADNPDFAALARVFGIDAFTLSKPDAMQSTLKAWFDSEGPALLHCICHSAENVFPMVSPGVGIDEMMEAT
jgi:acetolactate synthase-1/2/3 large subunit